MDSCALYAVVEDVLHLAAGGSPAANTKREARYFASSPSLTSALSDSDAESTWDFVPATPPKLSPCTSCDPKRNSAAQEIVDRYRAAQAAREFLENDADKTSVDTEPHASLASDSASVENDSISDVASTMPSPVIKARFRQSRSDAQAEAVRVFWLLAPAADGGQTKAYRSDGRHEQVESSRNRCSYVPTFWVP